MGTTADKLNKLLETKAAIRNAIISKGVEVADDTKFADYPSKIASIVGGGGGETPPVDPGETPETPVENSFYEIYFGIKTYDNTNYDSLLWDYNGAETELDLSILDTSNVTAMSYAFDSCSLITSLNLSNWDTSQVTTMSRMFAECESLTELDLSSFNTPSVTDMGYMFYYCSSLTSLDFSNGDMSSVTNATSMFYHCTNLTNFKAPKNIGIALSFSNSTKLTHDSLMSIINNLATVSSSTTLTLGSTNLSKLTDEEKAIATGKGWTLA